MEEKVLSGIGGVGMYGIISISIFFAFFTGMLIWVFFMKKTHVETMGELPLQDDESNDQDQTVNRDDL